MYVRKSSCVIFEEFMLILSLKVPILSFSIPKFDHFGFPQPNSFPFSVSSSLRISKFGFTPFERVGEKKSTMVSRTFCLNSLTFYLTSLTFPGKNEFPDLADTHLTINSICSLWQSFEIQGWAPPHYHNLGLWQWKFLQMSNSLIFYYHNTLQNVPFSSINPLIRMSYLNDALY